MPHELRYARQGGFRRPSSVIPPNSNANFGYGGAGYGGFGNKGQYGGYRSHYPSNIPGAMQAQYRPSTRPTIRMTGAPLLPTDIRQTDMDDDDTGSNKWFSHYNNKATFGFGVLLMVIVGLGIFFGMRKRKRTMMGGGGYYGYSPVRYY